MDRSQVGLIRLGRSAEGKLMHTGKVCVSVSSSDEPLNLALPEASAKFSAQGLFDD